MRFISYIKDSKFSMTGAKKGRPKKRVNGPKPKLSISSGYLVGYRNLSEKSKRVYKKEKRKEKEDPPATAP